MKFDRCENYRHLIEPYLDGEIPAEEKKEFEIHLKRCPACQSTYNELRKINSLVTSSIYKEPPYYYWNNLFHRISSIILLEKPQIYIQGKSNSRYIRRILPVLSAAAALIIATVFAIGQFFSGNSGNMGSKTAKSNSLTDQFSYKYFSVDISKDSADFPSTKSTDQTLDNNAPAVPSTPAENGMDEILKQDFRISDEISSGTGIALNRHRKAPKKHFNNDNEELIIKNAEKTNRISEKPDITSDIAAMEVSSGERSSEKNGTETVTRKQPVRTDKKPNEKSQSSLNLTKTRQTGENPAIRLYLLMKTRVNKLESIFDKKELWQEFLSTETNEEIRKLIIIDLAEIYKTIITRVNDPVLFTEARDFFKNNKKLLSELYSRSFFENVLKLEY